MKKLPILLLLTLALVLSGCGNSTSTTAAAVNGTWQAMLTLTEGSGGGEASVLSFNTQFSINNDNSLSVSSVTFLTTGTCFVSGATASGNLTVTSAAGVSPVTGNLSFVVQSGSPSGNTLTLTGTETGSIITGTFTLTGTGGCSGTGSFTMTQS